MKKTTLLTITLAAATLTACNNDNPTPGTGADEPNFTASIATAARAYDNTWESGDAIGISGQSGDKTYSNLKYTTDGTGAFAAAGDHIYFQNNAEVIFTAYYPWSDATATPASPTRATNGSPDTSTTSLSPSTRPECRYKAAPSQLGPKPTAATLTPSNAARQIQHKPLTNNQITR